MNNNKVHPKSTKCKDEVSRYLVSLKEAGRLTLRAYYLSFIILDTIERITDDRVKLHERDSFNNEGDIRRASVRL